MSDLTSHPPAPIPAVLDQRPKWKGYPIPFVIYVDANGVPDFRVNDERYVTLAVSRRLCALCGTQLAPNWHAFIGGPLCEANRLFTDGPMHVVCARYSMTVCPYLATTSGHHARDEAIAARHGDKVTILDTIGDQRPDKMGLFFTRSYSRVRIGGEVYYRTAEFEKVEWYA